MKRFVRRLGQPYRAQIALMNLPLVFRTTLSSIPADVSVLMACYAPAKKYSGKSMPAGAKSP